MACLLTSNDVPLDSEIPAIQQIISDDDDRLGALDAEIRTVNAEILHLQTTLTQLTQRRTDTIQHLREHRSIVSVVRRVPPELICEIFAWSAAQQRKTPPWRLGFISRAWRQHDVGYPSLWSCLTIPAYPLTETFVTLRLSALKAQISRMIMAYPASVSWLEPVRGKLSALERSEVINACRTTFPDVFETPPKLRHVALPQTPVGKQMLPAYWRTIGIPIPWAQIAHYQGERPVVQQLEILQASCHPAGLEIEHSVAPATRIELRIEDPSPHIKCHTRQVEKLSHIARIKQTSRAMASSGDGNDDAITGAQRQGDGSSRAGAGKSCRVGSTYKISSIGVPGAPILTLNAYFSHERLTANESLLRCRQRINRVTTPLVAHTHPLRPQDGAQNANDNGVGKVPQMAADALSARATLRTPACTHELAQCALRTYRPRRRKGALEQRAARAWVGSLRTGSSSAHVFTIHVILLVLEFTLRKTISGPPAGASATDESHRL
ncbi:hypothetical protein C8R45DRAFT_944829 [Mycena sanguinolenta]|nr:hypothetical protein C8R45DRAFT_944829 [Mycena sanguinolenta]